jgi:hypothetical protein
MMGLALREAGISDADFSTVHERRVDALMEQIRVRPITTLLIAAGLGYLLGLLTR